MSEVKLDGVGQRQGELLQFLLRNKEGLTVDQLSGALAISRTAVNQHLAALERDGYVREAALAATGGRPGRKFTLTTRGLHLFPKKYDLFSTLLLETMLKTMGRDNLLVCLEKLGADMAQPLKEGLAGKTLAEKTIAVAAYMNEIGFDASAPAQEKDAPPVIRANNCIYHELAQQNQDVCRLDLALLAEATGAKVEHTSCMAKGAGACQFAFR